MSGPSILTGNLVAYDRDRLGFLRRCQRQYGDWVSIDRRTVLVGDAQAVSQTLYATNTVFSLETNNVEATGGPGALAERAAEHAMARRRIVRALAKSPVERHVPILHAILERQLTGLHGQRIDLTALLQRAFGTAAVQYMTSCDDAGLVEVIAELHAAGIAMTAESVDLPLWLPSGRRRRLRRATARAGMRLRELTERRLEDPGTTEHADVLGAALADSEFSAPGEDLEVGLMAALRSSLGVARL